MRINSNSTAILTGSYLTRSENKLAKSTERLSSGYKINDASDAPAGYAISSKMRAQIRSLEKASDNVDTAVDFIQTGEGAMVEVQEMVQRMNELAIKAANGTMTTADRDAIQAEVDQLCDEVERIAKQTEFNDQPILNGNYEYRGYVTNTLDVKVLSYSEAIAAGDYNVAGISVTSTATGNKDKDGNEIYEYSLGADTYKLVDADGNETELKAEMVGDSNVLRLSNKYGVEIELEIPQAGYTGDLELELNKMGAMRIQIGDNEGQVIEMDIPEISLKKMGIENVDMTTQEKAKEAIEKVSQALDYTSKVRSKFGAYQNRLEHSASSLDVYIENLNSSYSTIKDTDMAEEMTQYTSLQVLQQAATSMLAQANQFPQQALQLLQ